MTYIYEKKQTSDLYHDLKRMGRDNFSYDGATALMEWLEELAGDQGEPIEYDPIAFCCDFAEYSTEELPVLASEYSDAPQAGEFEDPEEWEAAFKEWLADETTVIEFDGGLIAHVGAWLYRAENMKLSDLEHRFTGNHQLHKYEVLHGREVQARFYTEKQARNYIAFMQGKRMKVS